MEAKKLKQIIEAALMTSGGALKLEQLMSLFEGDEDVPATDDVLKALHELMEECGERGVELKEVSSGFRYQARQELSQWVQRLWEEKPQRYSRALLETLALIAYRQPITRAEIEEVRGVSVSSTIIKTLQEREWVRVVGHRDVPGKPAMYATTKGFLDYFNLQSLDELPTLAEIRDIDNINAEFAFGEGETVEDAGANVESGADETAQSVESIVKVSTSSSDEAVRSQADVSVLSPLAIEEPMQGLSDEEMKAIDAMNKSFRENLHGRVVEEEIEDEVLEPELSALDCDDDTDEVNASGVHDISDDSSMQDEARTLEQENNL